MRNIEVKTVVDGEFAVIKEFFRDRDETFLNGERSFINLNQVELFKIGRTSYEKSISFERCQKYCEETEKYFYTDGFPGESKNFKRSFSSNWNLTIPEGTPEIILYFPKYKFSLLFLNQDEYMKVYNALTEELV